MYKALTRCPVCSGKLNIKRLQCDECNTVIENNFTFSKFGKLNHDQLRFVETFLQYRGNIKDVEKALGLSSKKQHEIDRKHVITKLENGEITSDEAIELLNKI